MPTASITWIFVIAHSLDALPAGVDLATYPVYPNMLVDEATRGHPVVPPLATVGH